MGKTTQARLTWASRKSDGISYETWYKALSGAIARKTGVPLDCGEDVDSYTWYDSDFSLKSAFEEVLDVWGFNDFEF